MDLPRTAGVTADIEVGGVRKGSPVTYAVILALAMFLGGAIQLRLDGILACPASYLSDSYLAYCQARGYSDYDRGGYWYDLEPSAARAASAAQVLFLGSSRMQFAFSSEATRAWFQKARASHYLLGFSHTENVQFVGPLLEKLGAKAEAYVINVDRFFDDRLSEPAVALFNEANAMEKYIAKQQWQKHHGLICSMMNWICGSHAAFYRNRGDGHWYLSGAEAQFMPAPVSDGGLDSRVDLNKFARLAEDFVSGLPVVRECVLLTVVPYSGTKRDEARHVAQALGMRLIEPRAGILRTFDGSHLDPESAELWSEAFFELAGEQITTCQGTSQRSTSEE